MVSKHNMASSTRLPIDHNPVLLVTLGHRTGHEPPSWTESLGEHVCIFVL